MKRDSLFISLFLILIILLLPGIAGAQTGTYKDPDQVLRKMKQLEEQYPGVVSLINIASTPGDRSLSIIQIGKGKQSGKNIKPAVFVGANLEGNRPLTTEGAIFLAEALLEEPSHFDSMKWFIMPLGNPDAAAKFFQRPLMEDARNALPANDDLDEQIDEDGANDLNGDGWITRMRVMHPDGEWIISESDPRLMKKADPKKGEQGIYKLFTEGIDDDGDGLYNEDGPGGINVGINFPQLFKHYTADGGLFPGSAPESYAIMKFVFEHPEIAMMVSLGSTNWCYTPPKGGRKGEKDLNNIRLSERQARQFNLDPGRSYSLSELVEAIKANNPQSRIDESMIMGYLGLSAALNPQAGDLVFYEKFAADYKAFLKEQGVHQERLEPAPAKDGSFELWGYFQVGVPVFSMDLWGISKQDSGSAEEALLAVLDGQSGHTGFVEWKAFDHPSLGAVEIGGFVPYAGTTPPYEMVDSLLNLQVPWILKLAGELPDLHIYETLVSAKGDGIYQLDIWIENRAYIPFPTDMGKRNRQPAPAVLTLEAAQLNFISGKKRTPISSVAGKSRLKTTFILQVEKPGDIVIRLESKSAGHDLQTINIGG